MIRCTLIRFVLLPFSSLKFLPHLYYHHYNFDRMIVLHLIFPSASAVLLCPWHLKSSKFEFHGVTI